MTLRHLAAKTLLAFAGIAAATSALAGFNGIGFSTYYGFPAEGTPYGSASASPSSFIVGAGTETVFDVEGVTTITVDFSDNVLSLVLNTILSNPTWNATAFNGLVFDVMSGGPLSFAGFTVDPATTMAGFTAARVGLGDDRLTIDWNGLSYVDGTRVIVDFTPVRAVPEPETYALMLAGFAALGALSRSRRRPRAG